MGSQEGQRRSQSLWCACWVNKCCCELLPLRLSGSAQPCLCWYPQTHTAPAALVAPGTRVPCAPGLGMLAQHPHSHSSFLGCQSSGASGIPARGVLRCQGIAGAKVMGPVRKRLSLAAGGTDQVAWEHAAGSQHTCSQTAPGDCRKNLLLHVWGASSQS